MSSLFLSLLIHRRNRTFKPKDKVKHQSAIKIVAITIFADLTLGFVPCAIKYVLVVFQCPIAFIIAPGITVFYTMERMVMLSSYLFLLKKQNCCQNVVQTTVKGGVCVGS